MASENNFSRGSIAASGWADASRNDNGSDQQRPAKRQRSAEEQRVPKDPSQHRLEITRRLLEPTLKNPPAWEPDDAGGPCTLSLDNRVPPLPRMYDFVEHIRPEPAFRQPFLVAARINYDMNFVAHDPQRHRSQNAHVASIVVTKESVLSLAKTIQTMAAATNEGVCHLNFTFSEVPSAEDGEKLIDGIESHVKAARATTSHAEEVAEEVAEVDDVVEAITTEVRRSVDTGAIRGTSGPHLKVLDTLYEEMMSRWSFSKESFLTIATGAAHQYFNELK
jgi:hypothetical protein